MDLTAILALLTQVDWVQVFTVLITILFFISELLGNIPQVKQNSVYQVIKTVLTKLKDMLSKKQGKGKDHQGGQGNKGPREFQPEDKTLD